MSPKLTRKYSVFLIFIHPLRCATLQVKSNIRFVMQIFHLVPDIYVMAYFKCIEGNRFSEVLSISNIIYDIRNCQIYKYHKHETNSIE